MRARKRAMPYERKRFLGSYKYTLMGSFVVTFARTGGLRIFSEMNNKEKNEWGLTIEDRCSSC